MIGDRKRGRGKANVTVRSQAGAWERAYCQAGAWERAGLLIFFAILIPGCSSPLPDKVAPPPSPKKHSSTDPTASFKSQLDKVLAGSSQELRLDSELSSTEFARVAGLDQLQVLVVDAGRLTDADVSVIETLLGLEHLRLRECPLTDTGLSQLGRSRLHRLAILNAPQAKPTRDALRELGKLPKLRQLRIGGRQIDDAAVTVLARWPSLTSLHLIGPSITDASLRTIADMEQLASFYLDDCPLSDSAWEELFRKRPRLHVHVDQVHHDRDPGSH